MSNALVRRVFHSRQSLTTAVAGAGGAALALAALVLGLQIGTSAPSAGPGPVAPSFTEPVPTVNPDLIPPTAEPVTPARTPTGSPVSIALEASQAFLNGDLERFSGVALPAAVDSVAEAPTGDLGRLEGEVQVLESGTDVEGREAATVEVPTSGGPLQLVLVVSEGRWQVMAIRYVRS